MTLLAIDQELSKQSYYAATASRERGYPRLEGESSCDVAIVGGGLAGLSAALELADHGVSVALLEARQVGWGASGRNGGQALAGLACDHSVVSEQLGLAASRQVWDMTLEAIRLIDERRRRFAIDCDWQPGYLGLAVNARKAAELRRSVDTLRRDHGYQVEWIEPSAMERWIASPRYHSGIHDPAGAHLHPLKYSLGLARAAAGLGARLHEGSAVTAVESLGPNAGYRVRTDRGQLLARHVLLAGNVYLQGVAKVLESRIMPVGTYIVASERLDKPLADSLVPSRAAVCDTNFVLDYFRTTADDRMLYGGRVSYSTQTPANLAEGLRRRMVGTFPQLDGRRIEFAWGGFVDITMNRAPDFGRLSDRLRDAGDREADRYRDVYYLQGFSGHGLALTGLAGQLVAEAIRGSAQRFDLFARLRHRPFPGGELLRMPALVLGMAYYRLKDLL
jgi:gamma-glutamylputrescine oxidase